ncbi:MAG: monofunctional biosynthetic peptidoglycan transglycosylase, partial [Propylenella sp.]
MTKRRPRRSVSRLRRAFRRVAAAILIYLALPYVLLPLYSNANPPISAVMIWKLFAGAPPTRTWVDLDQVSPHLVRAVLMAEDGRFCEHNGVDWVEVQNALDDEGRLRGASTITMQTVKNLFLWTGRSWIRKGLEVPLALYADFVLPKRRIMEIYLNIVEWGAGTYGAEAAARRYFGIGASELSASQAARLAAVLPSPETRDAASPGPGTA